MHCYRDYPMALDQIWKQQLTLVSYGNEFFAQRLDIKQWVQHQVFNQHQLAFRDLHNQHLLAQHFQIWLEALKQQGVSRISLHHASLLEKEQNPNSNVELLPISHFIVSHHGQKKIAWIFGQELAEWYLAEENYTFPPLQQSQLRHETYWRFELNPKLSKLVDQDLNTPNWDDIEAYTEFELFENKCAQGFSAPEQTEMPYFGITDHAMQSLEYEQYLPLLPNHLPATYAHQTLYRLEALSEYIQTKINHPYDEQGEILSPEIQMNLRHFSQKVDEITAKFIVKVANHYATAQLSVKSKPSPFDPEPQAQVAINPRTEMPYAQQSPNTNKVSKFNVLTLIIITLAICLAAYYWGL